MIPVTQALARREAVAAARVPLPRGSVYRSAAGRAEVFAYYDRVLAGLPLAPRTLDLPTSFGRTRLTLAGPEGARPLLVLPGMSIPGPLMLRFFMRQGRERLLIAPDLVGHPGRSEDRVHSPASHGYGRWLGELLDGLGLETADVLSGSFGSSVALDLAAIAPERVGRQALIMPAGLTPRIPYAQIALRFAPTWMRYRFRPDRARLPAVAGLLATRLGSDEMDFLDIVVRQTAFWRHRPAGPFGPADFAGYRAPLLLMTAGRDPLFPPAETLNNALAALNVVEDIRLAYSLHMPDPAQLCDVQERIAAFFG